MKNGCHGSIPFIDDVSDIAAPLFQGCFVANENRFRGAGKSIWAVFGRACGRAAEIPEPR
jgi:hypothetical protein